MCQKYCQKISLETDGIIGILFGVTMIGFLEVFEFICFIIYIVIRHVLTTNLVEVIRKLQNKMKKKVIPKNQHNSINNFNKKCISNNYCTGNFFLMNLTLRVLDNR